MKSQTEKLYDLLKNGDHVRTDRIMLEVYGASHLGIARISARIGDIKKKYGVRIEGEHDRDNPSLYWYWIAPETSEPSPDLVEKYPAIFQREKINENKQASML